MASVLCHHIIHDSIHACVFRHDCIHRCLHLALSFIAYIVFTSCIHLTLSLIAHISHLTSHVPCLTSHVSCLMSHVFFAHTSCISQLMSHTLLHSIHLTLYFMCVCILRHHTIFHVCVHPYSLIILYTTVVCMTTYNTYICQTSKHIYEA